MTNEKLRPLAPLSYFSRLPLRYSTIAELIAFNTILVATCGVGTTTPTAVILINPQILCRSLLRLTFIQRRVKVSPIL